MAGTAFFFVVLAALVAAPALVRHGRPALRLVRPSPGFLRLPFRFRGPRLGSLGLRRVRCGHLGWKPLHFVQVCVGLAAPAFAEPLLFDPAMPDPRTAGELPPGRAAPTEPLKPSFELPGGGLWLRGEVPSGAADPDRALRGARAEAGVRLPLFTGTGFGWGVTPKLAGAASSAAGTEPSAASPHVGFALGQDLSLSLPFGLRLGAEGTVGDRLGVGGLSTATAPVSSDLAMRAGVTLSTDLAVPFLEAPLHIGLGLATAGTLPGIGPGFATAGAPPGDPARGAAGRRWYDADDCRVSLEIGRVGGAPLRVSSGCLVTPGAVPPVTVGFRAAF